MGNNRVVIITGGSGGIGSALKTAFEEGGATVIDWSRRTGVDVRRVTDLNRQAKSIYAEHSRIDVLVNCAGLLGPYRPFISGNYERSHLTRWINTLDTNLLG